MNKFMKKLSIIIVDYRSKPFIDDFLKSLGKAIMPEGWQKEIIIIDNNRINRGFAKAVNMGIRKAGKFDAILLLNPDTLVDKGFLVPLLSSEADICAPLIKFRRQGKWLNDFGGKVNLNFGRCYHVYKSQKIDFVSGCAMLIKRPVWQKIGFLNENYFLYFEDVDYCLRAKKAGFKVEVEPRSIITHFLNEKRSVWQKYQLLRNNLRFINRWISFPRRLMAWAYWKLLVLRAIL